MLFFKGVSNWAEKQPRGIQEVLNLSSPEPTSWLHLPSPSKTEKRSCPFFLMGPSEQSHLFRGLLYPVGLTTRPARNLPIKPPSPAPCLAQASRDKAGNVGRERERDLEREGGWKGKHVGRKDGKVQRRDGGGQSPRWEAQGSGKGC